MATLARNGLVTVVRYNLARVTSDDDTVSGLVDPMIGRTVDVFRIEKEIGHGGMGTVYLARRRGEFEQTVALKIVRRGMDTALVLERFVSERQILAGLDHPNITRLIDGGSTDDGRPYFVMEHLDAVPITVYCARHALPVEARIRLFLVACAAVQYAHQRLVVHRDLKPGNVLVTADGTPKLLDFGLARLLDDPARSAACTRVSERLLTPDYASPEQLRGLETGIPSDVYSLGVILHELLTGRLPDSPAAPSAVAPAGVARRLRGDLDTIVAAALHPDPTRRYQAVHELSADLQRHLESRPIVARADSVLYRAGKFARRHRTAMIAAGLIVASLSSGLVLAARSARIAGVERARAERRLDDVRRLTRSLLFDLHDEIGTLPGNIAVRQHLLARAVAHLDQLSTDTGADRALQLETASAYDRAGVLAFDMHAAMTSYRKAAALFERLLADGPGETAAVVAQIQNLHNIGDLQKMMGDVDAALEAGHRALAIAQRLSETAPASLPAPERSAIAAQLYRSHSLIGLIEEDAGAFERAIDRYQLALTIARASAAVWPHDAAWRRRIVVATTHLAINRLGQREAVPAVELLTEAAAAFDPLLQAAPINVNYQRDLWVIRLTQGRAELLLNRGAAAQRSIEEALAIKRRLADGDPGDLGHRRGLAVTHFALFEALQSQRRPGDALSHLLQAMTISRQIATTDTANLESQIDLGEFELAYGRALVAGGQDQQAQTVRQAAIERLRRAAERSPRNQRVAAMLMTGR